MNILHDAMEPQSLFENLEDLSLANHLNLVFDQVLIQHNITESLERVRRDEKDSFTQTIFQVRKLKLTYRKSVLFSLSFYSIRLLSENVEMPKVWQLQVVPML